MARESDKPRRHRAEADGRMKEPYRCQAEHGNVLLDRRSFVKTPR
jgi:hypothetical protein